MGSIGCFREKGLTDKQFLEELYPSFEILASARKSSVIYAAACKHEKPEEVFALVMPYSGRAGAGEFCVKEQDETQGPYDVACPAKILDMLTPTTYEYANEWRARCRAYLAEGDAASTRAASVVQGTIIRLKEVLMFSRGYGDFDTFKYTGKGNNFIAMRDGRSIVTVTLGPSWKRREYEVMT